MPDDPIEPEQPTEGEIPIEGSEMPTTEGEAMAAAPLEPGTEAEGIDAEVTQTSEVTQEAPAMEDAGPVVEEGAGVPPPQGPAFAIEYKPRSDVYTMLLIFTFMIFTTVAILAGKEAYDHYDCEFWIFGKETLQERKERMDREAAERAAEGGGPAPAPGPENKPPQ
jgi:hypothetical protein